MRIRLILISILAFLVLSSCSIDGPIWGVDRHQSLVAGQYSTEDDTRKLIMEIERGDVGVGVSVTLYLYERDENDNSIWSSSPSYTYEGTYKNFDTMWEDGYTYYYDFPRTFLGPLLRGEIRYPIDEFIFTSCVDAAGSPVQDLESALDEVNGKVGIIINPSTAYLESAYYDSNYHWRDFGNNVYITCTPFTKSEIKMIDYYGYGEDSSRLSGIHWIVESLSDSVSLPSAGVNI